MWANELEDEEMDTKWTPEPWAVGDSYSQIVGPKTRYRLGTLVGIATMDPSDHPIEDDANAARIVACVNACRGIPLDELQAGKIIERVSEAAADVLAERDALRAQVAELAAALQRAVDRLEQMYEHSGSEYSSPLMIQARAALAKVRP